MQSFAVQAQIYFILSYIFNIKNVLILKAWSLYWVLYSAQMDSFPLQKELANIKGMQPTLIIYCEIYFNSQFVQHAWKSYLKIIKQMCVNIVKNFMTA